jgi:hypothetical protein
MQAESSEPKYDKLPELSFLKQVHEIYQCKSDTLLFQYGYIG